MERRTREAGDWPAWAVFAVLSVAAIGLSGLLLGFYANMVPWVFAFGLVSAGLATVIAYLLSRRARRSPPSESR